jgi:hypothetical protein
MDTYPDDAVEYYRIDASLVPKNLLLVTHKRRFLANCDLMDALHKTCSSYQPKTTQSQTSSSIFYPDTARRRTFRYPKCVVMLFSTSIMALFSYYNP